MNKSFSRMSESGFIFLNFSSIDEKKIQAIRAFTHDLITKTMESLGVSYEVAFLLLDHFHWNTEELNAQWASSKNAILKEVHIDLGNAVPTLESHLAAEDCGSGTCPVCSRERRLLQLYCGHKICKDCYAEEIKNALNDNKKPACHHDDCGAEFLAPEVEKAQPHSKSAKIYKFWRLNLSYEEAPIKVAICPNPLCKNLIVRDKSLQCHCVRCSKCDFALCMHCQHDAHDPLKCCKRVKEFTETIPQDLNKLEEEEQKWYLRESRCKEYRFQKQNEVKQVFDANLRILVRAQENEQKEILQQIKNTDLFVQDLESKIGFLEEKIGEYKQKKRSAERIESAEKKIAGFREDIEHYKEFKKQLEKENETRKEERKKELEFAKEERKLYFNAIQDRENSEALLQKYKDTLNQYAQEKAVAVLNEDDYIRKDTVICPSCGFRFYKECGCCQVTCPCGYSFCTICNEPWITHKQGFYKCQNEIETKKVDYNDQNDSQFYPAPLNLEKKIYYAKWKHFHDSFVERKAKYDELYKKYLGTEDKEPQKGETLNDADLCPFSKLVKLFEQENSEEGRNNALRLVTNLLFAQSVAAWGYGAISYLNITEFTKEYTDKLENLEKKVDEFVEFLNDPENHPAQDLQDHLTQLKEETELVLKEKL